MLKHDPIPMTEIPFKRQDIGECGFIRYALDGGKGAIVHCFEALPDDVLYRQSHPKLVAPVWLFGHIVVKERDHVGGFAQGIWDSPAKYGILRGYTTIPSEDDLRECIPSRAEIIAYWDSVRDNTLAYLDSLSDEDLKTVPGHMGEPFDKSPIREFFAMTVHQQNYHWGQLYQIAEMYGVDPE